MKPDERLHRHDPARDPPPPAADSGGVPEPAGRDAGPGDAEHLGYRLTAYVLDNVSGAGRREVEAHLAACPSCRVELEELESTLSLLTEGLEADDLPLDAFDVRRRERVLAAAARRRHGGVGRWILGHPTLAAAAAVLVLLVPVSFLMYRLSSELVYRREVDWAANSPRGGEPRAPQMEPGAELAYKDYSVRDMEKEALRPPELAPPADAAGDRLEVSAQAEGLADKTEGLYRVARLDPDSTPSAAGTFEYRGKGAAKDPATRAASPAEAQSEEATAPSASPLGGAASGLAGPARGARVEADAPVARGQPPRVDGIETAQAEPAGPRGEGRIGFDVVPEDSESAAPAFGRNAAPETPSLAKERGLAASGDRPEKKRESVMTRDLRPASPAPSPSDLAAQDRKARSRRYLLGDSTGPGQDDLSRAPAVDHASSAGAGVADLGEASDRGRSTTGYFVQPQKPEGGAGAREGGAAAEQYMEEREESAGVAFGAVPGSDAAGSDAAVVKKDQAGREAQLRTQIRETREILRQSLQTRLFDGDEALRLGEVAAPGAGGGGGGASPRLEELYTRESVRPGAQVLPDAGRDSNSNKVSELAVLDEALGIAVEEDPGADSLDAGGFGYPQQAPGGQASGKHGETGTDRWASRVRDIISEFQVTKPPPSDLRRGATDSGRATAFGELLLAEKLLRAYAVYRANDSELTFERFLASPRPVPPPEVGDEGLGREGFRARYGTNPFVDTRRDHFSTFSMDVDTASFALARRFLTAGRLPPAEAMRVEEFVNYLDQEYPTDPGAVFSVFCDGMPSVFGPPGVELLRIGIKARELQENERRNAVLTVAVDVSGSMAGSLRESSRLDLVKEALVVLVDELRPTDQFGLVAFSNQAALVLPHTPAREVDRIVGSIRSLAPGGGTNLEAGFDLAYRLAYEALSPGSLHRVILVSDGVANVGARGPEEILQKVKVFARRGIYLSAIGVGKGDRYNDEMLKRLTSEGNGNLRYLDSLDEAQRIFRENLPETLEVLAEDAKIQVEFHPDAISHYRLLGYERRDIRDEDFRNDAVDAAEVGPGSTVTALYEIVRRPDWTGALGTVFVRYRDTVSRRVEEQAVPLPQGVIAPTVQRASAGLRLLACAAELAELLRGSYYARDGSLGQLLRELMRLDGEVRQGPQWRDLVEMTVRAQRLTVDEWRGSFSGAESGEAPRPR